MQVQRFLGTVPWYETIPSQPLVLKFLAAELLGMGGKGTRLLLRSHNHKGAPNDSGRIIGKLRL